MGKYLKCEIKFVCGRFSCQIGVSNSPSIIPSILSSAVHGEVNFSKYKGNAHSDSCFNIKVFGKVVAIKYTS